MGKYKLSELLNELSNAELAKIRLMQKLKSGEMSSDEFAAVGDSDDAAIAAMTADLVKKEKDLKNNFEEDLNKIPGGKLGQIKKVDIKNVDWNKIRTLKSMADELGMSEEDLKAHLKKMSDSDKQRDKMGPVREHFNRFK